jgi:hypothetical protein
MSFGKKAILAELVEMESDEYLKEHEFTVDEYRKALEDSGKRMSIGTARNRLNKLVEEGKLRVREGVFCYGHRRNVYSAVPKEEGVSHDRADNGTNIT